MTSMTGYGFAEHATDERHLSVEVRSVNNRYLDVNVNVPSFLAAIEPAIRTEVGTVASRGKVDVFVKLREFEVPVEIHVDPQAVAAAASALEEVGRISGITGSVAVRDLISFEGVVSTERKREPETYKKQILPILREALAAWQQQRREEGRRTREDVEAQLSRVENLVPVFDSVGRENERQIMEAVRTRFQEVLGDHVEEQRVYQEAAALIVKHNVNEEVVRLKSHIQLFRDTLGSGSTVGKKLDFVCQELNREVNTIASKALVPKLQAAVVDAKDAVEAMREQIRNIE